MTSETIAATLQRARISDEQRWQRITYQKRNDPTLLASLVASKEAKEAQERQQDEDVNTQLPRMRNATVSLARIVAEALRTRHINGEAELSRKAPLQYRHHPPNIVATPLWFVSERCLVSSEEFQLTTHKPDREGPLAKWVPIPPIFGVVIQTDIITHHGLQSTFRAERTEKPAEIDMDYGLWNAAGRPVSDAMARTAVLDSLDEHQLAYEQLASTEKDIPLRHLWTAEMNRQQGVIELAVRYGISV